MRKYDVSSCTDITGFGLLGHALECTNELVTFNISCNDVPIVNEAIELCANDVIPGGTKRNMKYVEEQILYMNNLPTHCKALLCDAQTSGGLLIAMSFIFGIEAFKEKGTVAAALMDIGGGAAFHIMVAVLSGYIAFSIADRPGLAPGLIGGMLASNIEAGFLGGIVSGFLAGYAAKWIVENIKLPKNFEGLMPVLVVPLLSTLVVGMIMIYIVGGPVGFINDSLKHFLESMSGSNAVLVGLIIGLMMAFDMGGPVNKAAYTVSVGLLASGVTGPIAAAMAAGMTPPLGIFIATMIAKNRFEKAELQAGKAAGVLGICFITEGAIPFAVKDPLRVIPSLMAGSAVAGAMVMGFGCTLAAPHGGISRISGGRARTGRKLWRHCQNPWRGRV